jgi:hypothetical protein
MDPDTLSAPERALWAAFPRGERVDLSGKRSPRGRSIRAEVISALLLGAVPAEPGQLAALRLDGARVTGALRLGHAEVTVPVRLGNCEFGAAVDLASARTRDVDLTGSRLAGLSAPLAQVDGDLALAGCECTGQVVLAGASVAGALRLEGSRICHPGRTALLGNRLAVNDDLIASDAAVDGEVNLAGARVGGIILLSGSTLRNEGGRALDASNTVVGARFLARDGFRAYGETRVVQSRIGADLNFRGARLDNPGGDALLAYGAQTGGAVVLTDGFTAHGRVLLSRASIGTALRLDAARLLNPGGEAIRCQNATGQTLCLDAGLETEGVADFGYSRFALLRDDPACWPARLRLKGFSYESIERPLPAAERVRWLRRDVDGFVPQNYETLAAVYRSRGDDAGARMVLLCRERERREGLPWRARAWSWLQEVTIGYGYRPLRAAGWLAGFVALGTLAFGLHHPPPLTGAPHPAFNPLIYTLDLLVPLVDLGMRSAYDPQGPQRWLAYLLIAVGWVFATTIAAGIARVLRRQ